MRDNRFYAHLVGLVLPLLVLPVAALLLLVLVLCCCCWRPLDEGLWLDLDG
jgi:hypothetical protein